MLLPVTMGTRNWCVGVLIEKSNFTSHFCHVFGDGLEEVVILRGEAAEGRRIAVNGFSHATCDDGGLSGSRIVDLHGEDGRGNGMIVS